MSDSIEIDIQEEVVPEVIEIYVDENRAQDAEDSAELAQQILEEVQELVAGIDQRNTILVDNLFTKVGQVFTANANSIWNIDGVQHTNSTSVVHNIPLAAAGKKRWERIVLNSSNTFQRVPGAEVVGNPAMPGALDNTLEYTAYLVTDTEVGEPSFTIVGSQFVKKEEFAQNYVYDSGNVTLVLDSPSTSYTLVTPGVITIDGFTATSTFVSSRMWVGKKLKITNKTGSDFDLAHNFSGLFPFRFPNGDFTLKNDYSAVFDIEKRDVMCAEFGYVSEDIPLSGFQMLSEKGQPNGYAELDGTGKVPATQLPSYVDDVVEVANYAALPVTGSTGVIYITLDNNKQFRWSGSSYLQITNGLISSTSEVPEGTNLYHTGARVLATVLTGISFVTGGAIVSTDTVLQAFGKLQKQINDILSALGVQSYKTITGNVTLDDTYHNCIVRITSTATITIPTGLRSDWAAVFDAVGSVTGTFVESGTTFSSPWGKKLANNAMGSIYTTSTNNFRLNGGFTV